MATRAYRLVIVTFIITLCLYSLFRTIGGGARRRGSTMAWRSSGSSNAGLINNLATNGLINSERVKKAMLNVCGPPAEMLLL